MVTFVWHGIAGCWPTFEFQGHWSESKSVNGGVNQPPKGSYLSKMVEKLRSPRQPLNKI